MPGEGQCLKVSSHPRSSRLRIRSAQSPVASAIVSRSRTATSSWLPTTSAAADSICSRCAMIHVKSSFRQGMLGGKENGARAVSDINECNGAGRKFDRVGVGVVQMVVDEVRELKRSA